MEMVFLLVVRTRVCDKKCAITTKQHNFWFLVLESITWKTFLTIFIIFHFLSFYENSHTFVWNNTFQDDRHLQYCLGFKFECLQIPRYFDQTWRKTIYFVLRREYCGLDTWTCNEDIDNQFFQKIEKSLSCTRRVLENVVFGQCTIIIRLTMLLPY